MKRILLIDYLRGISIFTIVVMHLCQKHTAGALHNAFAFGGAGVHVFILCSGFGLYLSHLHKPLSYVDFLKRRFARVYVPYAIAVVLWVLWLLASTGVFHWREAASHLLLYKMFSTEYDTSLCYPYWFISTIIQFYLFWPLIVKLVQLKIGGGIALTISLLWGTLVGALGYTELRPWGSFFLQYLWEFCLGMWIAANFSSYIREQGGVPGWTDVKTWKWWWLIAGAVGGMGLSALMAWNGGFLKLYNDIPSLVGYLSVMLLIYKVGMKVVNRFFVWASGFGYELYLVHSLVFAIMAFCLKDILPIYGLIALSLIAAYVAGYCYSWLLVKVRLK